MTHGEPPVVPQKWNGNRGRHRLRYRPCRMTEQGGIGRHNALMRHIVRGWKNWCSLRGGGGRGATMAWTIVHAFAVENYSRGHRVAPRFRLSGRIGSTGERNEGNRGNFWSLYQLLWKIEKYVTLSIRMFSKTFWILGLFEEFLGRLYSNCLSRAGIISLNFWIDIILIILIIFDDSSNRVYFLKSF